jgi:hypothetical protein
VAWLIRNIPGCAKFGSAEAERCRTRGDKMVPGCGLLVWFL